MDVGPGSWAYGEPDVNGLWTRQRIDRGELGCWLMQRGGSASLAAMNVVMHEDGGS